MKYGCNNTTLYTHVDNLFSWSKKWVEIRTIISDNFTSFILYLVCLPAIVLISICIFLQRLSFSCWRSKWIKLRSSWPAGYCSCVLNYAKQGLAGPWIKLWSYWPGYCSCVLHNAKQRNKLKQNVTIFFLRIYSKFRCGI